MGREKALVALLLILIALSISFSGLLSRVDHLIFDVSQRLSLHPVPNDIVIVAVDQDSLDRIGRWPWPREVHARLLNIVCAAQPVAVGLDMAFIEPSVERASDEALALAVAECGRVVLPILIEASGVGGLVLESPPFPKLLAAAAGLGRVGARLDEDGIARSVDLREGVGQASWPLFAEELLRVAKLAYPPSVPPIAEPDIQPGLIRAETRRVEFAGAPGTIPSISYARVLQGDVSPDFFAGKTVLVGTTATGLGDFLPTPLSAYAQPMSGVEVQANIWQSMRTQRLIGLLPTWVTALSCALLALVPMLWLTRLLPFSGLLVSTFWMIIPALVSALLLEIFHVWLPPSGALLAGFVAFPLWSWRKLEVARRHFDQELQQLGRFLQASGEEQQSVEAVRRMGFEQRIAWVQAAQQQMQRLETQRSEALTFISHDLRSPLASAVQRLEEQEFCESALLLPSLRRAQQMAQDFLQLARAETLKPRQMKNLDLIAILDQAADEVYGLLRQRGQTLVRQITEEFAWVQGDFSALERCAINLLNNAATYAPPATSIAMGLDRPPGALRFWVENDGIAFTADEKLRLFQRFHRGKQGENRQTSSGLGLYYVRTVAEKHGGSVGVICAAGKIRFWLSLPADSTIAARER